MANGPGRKLRNANSPADAGAVGPGRMVHKDQHHPGDDKPGRAKLPAWAKIIIPCIAAIVVVLIVVLAGGAAKGSVLAGESDAASTAGLNESASSQSGNDRAYRVDPGSDLQKWEAFYAPVLKEYSEGIANGFEGYPLWDQEHQQVYDVLNGVIVSRIQAAGAYPNGLEDVSAIYTIADLDGNGTFELLLGTRETTGDETIDSIWDIWTVSNDQPLRIASMQTDSNTLGLKINLDGNIAETNIANLAAYSISKIDEDGVRLTKVGTISSFQNAGGGESFEYFDDATSAGRELTEAEYNDLLGGYAFDTDAGLLNWVEFNNEAA